MANYQTIDQADLAGYDGALCQIKRFDAVVSDAGANTLVAAAPGKKLLIRSLSLRPLGAAVAVHLKTEDSDNVLVGTSFLAPATLDKTSATGPAEIALPWNPDGWAVTATAGKALEIVLGAAQPVGVTGSYIEIG